MALEFRYLWRVRGIGLVAARVSVADPPTTVLIPDGWVVMTGAPIRWYEESCRAVAVMVTRNPLVPSTLRLLPVETFVKEPMILPAVIAVSVSEAAGVYPGSRET
jgi:hypothetical protein